MIVPGIVVLILWSAASGLLMLLMIRTQWAQRWLFGDWRCACGSVDLQPDIEALLQKMPQRTVWMRHSMSQCGFIEMPEGYEPATDQWAEELEEDE